MIITWCEIVSPVEARFPRPASTADSLAMQKEGFVGDVISVIRDITLSSEAPAH